MNNINVSCVGCIFSLTVGFFFLLYCIIRVFCASDVVHIQYTNNNILQKSKIYTFLLSVIDECVLKFMLSIDDRPGID